MGEEYGEENPFPFFCSFRGEELVEAVREGRRREYSAHDRQSEVPDPDAQATFASARLSAGRGRKERRGQACGGCTATSCAARREWPALSRLRESVGAPDPGPGREPCVLELVRGAEHSQFGSRLSSTSAASRSRFPRSSTGVGGLLFSSEAAIYSGAREQIG